MIPLASLRNHAVYGGFNDTFRFGLQQVLSNSNFQAAWVHRVTVVFLVLQFLAGQVNLLSVDNNYEISSINMWSELRFVFATDQSSGFAGQTTKCFAFGINNVPIAFNFVRLRHIGGTHECFLLVLVRKSSVSYI
ncbi:hypothetical protein D3C87_1638170 [compost metagenome]